MLRLARVVVLTSLLIFWGAAASAQSLFIAQGARAIEASAAWSVGPFSNGIETHVGVSLDGRWDVGFGFNRYAADFGGDDDTTLTEWSPFARYFLFKEQDDATPVSLAAHAAFFQDHYEGGDDGWYALAGGQLFKRFDVAETLALLPYVGFSFAAESLGFGGGEAQRSVYLTRQFGVLALMPLGGDTWLRVTAEEQAFRRETYRAARVAFIRRF